jgi:hypothetical protein
MGVKLPGSGHIGISAHKGTMGNANLCANTSKIEGYRARIEDKILKVEI